MLDLAGSGESSHPDAPYTLDWHADVVAGWLAALGLDQVDLVGHSYGGGVAQWMLLEHGSRVRRLGLEASGGLGREVGIWLRWASFPFFVERFGQPFMAFGTTRSLNAAGGAFSADEIARLAGYNARPGTARAFSRSVRDVIDARGQHRHMLDRVQDAPSLPPVALFWGDDDPLIPVAHGSKPPPCWKAPRSRASRASVTSRTGKRRDPPSRGRSRRSSTRPMCRLRACAKVRQTRGCPRL